MAADLVLLTLLPATPGTARSQRLGVVVLRRADGVAVLPGRLLRERQTVAAAVQDILDVKLAIPTEESPDVDLLRVHDAPGRDPRGWVIALAFVGSVPLDAVRPAGGAGVEVLRVGGDAGSARGLLDERLGYDHDAMVAAAVVAVRSRYEQHPDPLGLLAPPYSLSTLRRAHEAVLDVELKRDTFNRRMREHLVPARDGDGRELFTSATGGRPAQLFHPVAAPRQRTPEQPFALPRVGPQE